MEQEILNTLQALKEIQCHLAPEMKDNRSFSKPSMEDIKAFEQKIGTQLPEDFVQVLLHNDFAFTTDGNYQFLNFATIQGNWEMMQRLLAEGKFEGRCERLIASGSDNWEGDYIQKSYWCTQWIPFAEDSCGNMKCIDLAPAENGTFGQILAFELQDGFGPCIDWTYETLEEFLVFNLGYLQDKKYRLSPECGLEIDRYIKV